jgi:cellulose synthase/poly-beta-1,6-N-acetylglucosamine synthase-like glycosyltransferase
VEDWRVSLVVPVRDEECSVDALIDSIEAQTLRPDEVLIVDGGSRDRTCERVRCRAERASLSIRLVEGHGPLLPGAGRNLGVEQARQGWIAFTDAGIQLDPRWLERLVERARRERDLEVVYGDYVPATPTRHAVAAAIAYVPAPEPTPDGACRPPAVVSMLIRRATFLSAGGFPGQLRSAEDLLFLRRLAARGVRSARQPEARVTWQTAPDLASTFRRFRTYAGSNLQAGLGREWQRPVLTRYAAISALSVAVGPLAPAAFAMLAGGMLGARGAAAMWRKRRVYPSSGWERLRRFGGVTLLLATIDAAMMIGSCQWLWQHGFRRAPASP